MIKSFKLILLQVLMTITIYASEQDLKDTVQIGNQVWMRTNLNVTTFQNGDSIFVAKNSTEWEQASLNKIPACRNTSDSTLFGTCGKLYNWYAVNDPRGLAPKGLKIPTNEDFKELLTYLEIGISDGLPCFDYDSNLKIMSKNSWRKLETNNESGFSAEPCDYCDNKGEYANNIYITYTSFWSSSEYDSKLAYEMTISTHSVTLNTGLMGKSMGASVRCITK